MLERLTGSEMNKLTVANMQVEALRKQVTDAQATIAALQEEVKELEDDRSAWKEIAQDWSAAAKLAEQPEKFYDGYSAAVMNAMQALLTKARADLTQRTAELERVRDQFADLRKMVAALPKVEGEIRLIHADDGDWHVVDLYDAIFTDKSWAVSYAALLQHRQGMEG